jgi:hypothetical protein
MCVTTDSLRGALVAAGGSTPETVLLVEVPELHAVLELVRSI